MSDFTYELIGSLFRSSAFLAMSAVLVGCLLKLMKIESVRVHALAWGVVLLQGLIPGSFSIEIEVLDAPEVSDIVSDPSVEMLDDVGLRPDDSQLKTAVAQWAVQPAVSNPAKSDPVAAAWSLHQILFTIWVAGVAMAMGVMIVSYTRFLWRLSEPLRADNDWLIQWEHIQHELYSGAPIQLHVTHALGPAICWTPSGYRLLIPSDAWQTLGVVQRAAILRHEIAHFQRSDLRNGLLFRLIAAVHWFNPFAWLAVGKLAECAEWSCDDFVRKFHSAQSAEYVRALVRLSTPHHRVPVVIPAAAGHSLIRRAQRLLKPQLKEDSGMKKLTMLLLIVALVLANVVSFELVAQETVSQTRTTTKTITKTIVVNSDATNSPPPAADLPTESSRVAQDPTRHTGSDQTSTTGDLPTADEGISIAPSAELKLSRPDDIQIQLTGLRSSGALNEAVIDLAYIFKNLPEFIELKESLQEDVETADSKARNDSKAIEKLARRLQHFSGDERKALSVSLAEKQAKTKIDLAVIRSDLRNREARIYFQVFRKVRTAIAEHAKENGIRIVRRFERDQHEELESGNPASILQAMNQQVLYVADDSIDITDAVLTRLKKDRQDARTPKASSVAPLSRNQRDGRSSSF